MNYPIETFYAPAYDYYRFSHIQPNTNYSFFQFPMGSNTKIYQGMIKDKRTWFDTNMSQIASFPFEFTVTAIRCYTNARGFERLKLLDDGHLEFIIGDKRYVEGSPLATFPALFDSLPFSFGNLDKLDEPFLFLQRYLDCNKALLYQITPLIINKHQSFEVRLNFEKEHVFQNSIKLGVILDGYPFRSVV